MNKFLNNLLKGLFTAFVLVCVGGFIGLQLKMSPTNQMVLVSTSFMNSIGTKIDSSDTEPVSNVEDETDLDKEENSEDEKESEELEVKTEQKTDSETIKKEETTVSENKTEEENKNTNVTNNNQTVEVSVQGEYAPNLEVLSTVATIATYTGKITAYGPDCYGCTSGRTASGQYVMDGNIYYNDKTFGNIRIVAGDRSLPFGSIIKISGLSISNDPILAIVLDRGGMIGFADGKHAYFDLLYKTEKDASSFGLQNATFELLRSGY